MTAFTVISCLFVLSGLFSALVIACDLLRHPQSMRIMYSVWVLTGLWAGLPGLWAYFRFGRGPQRGGTASGFTAADTAGMKRNGKAEAYDALRSMNAPVKTEAAHGIDAPDKEERAQGMQATAGMRKMDGMTGMPATTDTKGMPGKPATTDMQGMDRMDGMPDQAMPRRPHWQSVVLSTLHCGAGCTLADLIGEWALFLFPVAIAGSYLAGSWVIDYALALALGVYFQYAAIRSMRRISRRRAVVNALKADVLSLTAWQAGMYAWMALVIFGLRRGAMFPRTSWPFWFMMQAAMYCGFLLSLPVNVLLIRKHIKHAM